MARIERCRKHQKPVGLGKRHHFVSILSAATLIIVISTDVGGQRPAQTVIYKQVWRHGQRSSRSWTISIAKNAERTAALQRYQSRRYYQLDYTGFPTSLKAEMVVDMLYEAPATKKFKIVSQSGPKWMVDRIFKGLMQAEQEALNSQNRERVALDRRNYEFSGMEFQEASDGCSYVLTR